MPKKEENSSNLESTVSLFLGIVVVFIVGFLLFRYFKNASLGKKLSVAPESEEAKEEQKETAVTETENPKEPKTEEPVTSRVTLPIKYHVQKGDNLWEISLRFYGSGYNWVDISKENSLTKSNLLLVGQELSIPNVSPRIALKTEKISSRSFGEPIEGNIYTVVKGDNLWKISVRAYQDGYKWTIVAKANNLINPNLIHPGNVLTIPR